MSMKEFFSWASQHQDKYTHRVNNIFGTQQRFSVTPNAHQNYGQHFNQKASEILGQHKITEPELYEESFVEDNLYFETPKMPESIVDLSEQDKYDRLVNATPEQRERLRELDRRQQARENNPTTGKYISILRTGGLDAAISALEDDGRQDPVGQMRTDMASGAMKPRGATQTADSAIDSASSTQPDPMADQTPSFDFTKPMVKNPAGGLMPDPNLAQSTIDDAPQPTGPSDFEKGKEEGIRLANRNYTGGVTITKGGRSTIGSKQGMLGSQSSLGLGPRDLNQLTRGTAAQAFNRTFTGMEQAGKASTSSEIANLLMQREKSVR